MIRLTLACAAALLLLLPAVAHAEGPHDMDCLACHSTHYAKGDYVIGVEPLKKAVNPARTRTRPSVEDIDALCLGCHNNDMGIMPINLRTTHPTGVKPTYTPVPAELLWDGVFTCVSCHNPHPSNANYKYLVVNTDGGRDMGTFCAKCHPGQSDPAVLESAQSAPMTYDPAGPPIVKVEPDPAQ